MSHPVHGLEICYTLPNDSADQAAQLLSPLVWGGDPGDAETYISTYLTPGVEHLYGLKAMDDAGDILAAAEAMHSVPDHNLIGQPHTAVTALKVAEAYHRHGLGRRLMGYVAIQALEHNDDIIAVVSYNKAIPFYTALGFEPVGDPMYKTFVAQATELASSYITMPPPRT